MKRVWNEYFRYNIPFFILASIAVILLIVAFILLDKSVLEGASLIFAFAALWTVHTAVVKGVGAKIKHHDLEVEIGDKEEDQM